MSTRIIIPAGIQAQSTDPLALCRFDIITNVAAKITTAKKTAALIATSNANTKSTNANTTIIMLQAVIASILFFFQPIVFDMVFMCFSPKIRFNREKVAKEID